MTTQSDIEWTDATWSPVIGCTKESPGCKNCYAEREVETRWSKNPRSMWFGRKFTDISLRAEALSQPLGWRAPRRIFVCPRADLFHPDVPFGFIAAVFGTMAVTTRHTYQVLTKRAKRMREFFETVGPEDVREYTLRHAGRMIEGGWKWPLPNVHVGVSVENQEYANERIHELLATPAAVRWISAEPLLGLIDLNGLPDPKGDPSWDWSALHGVRECAFGAQVSREKTEKLDWVVVGGESGAGARPMHTEWAISLRDQCREAGVPFFFKQWGEYLQGANGADGKPTFARVGKRTAGRDLGGREWNEVPLEATKA